MPQIITTSKRQICSWFILIFLFLVQCKQSAKKEPFQDIKDYFESREWDFPIAVLDTTLTIKYYPDTLPISSVSDGYADVRKITVLHRNTHYVRSLLERVIVDTSRLENIGYVISKPTVVIDTSIYGAKDNPKIFLGFNVSRYKINADSLSKGIPCENCLVEENNKILRYPTGIFFELNTRTDSLIFSRWD